jgi:hypothetical protein
MQRQRDPVDKNKKQKTKTKYDIYLCHDLLLPSLPFSPAFRSSGFGTDFGIEFGIALRGFGRLRDRLESNCKVCQKGLETHDVPFGPVYGAFMFVVPFLPRYIGELVPHALLHAESITMESRDEELVIFGTFFDRPSRDVLKTPPLYLLEEVTR